MRERDDVALREARDRRRASRWQAAVETLGEQWVLEACAPGALAPHLPFALAPAPDRSLVIARGAIAGAPAQLIECETRLRVSGEATSVESLVVVLEIAHAIGTTAIEFDPLTAFGGATPRDPEIGHRAFDRCYRVHAPSARAAQASIPVPLAEQVLARRFRGTLEIRTGRVIACFPETRLSPPAARVAARLARSIVRGLARPSGGPYRGSGDPRR